MTVLAGQYRRVLFTSEFGEENAMHWCVHGGAGVLFANFFPEEPTLALAVSFLFHYPLDWLPHKDPRIGTDSIRWQDCQTQEFLTLTVPDLAITLLMAWLVPTMVVRMPFWTTAGCVLASVLPDVVDGMARLGSVTVLQWHRRFHEWIHYNSAKRPVPTWLNAVIQLGLITAIGVAVTSVVVNGPKHANGP